MNAPTSGFPLTRHNVFFARDYAQEFEDICQRGSIPERADDLCLRPGSR